MGDYCYCGWGAFGRCTRCSTKLCHRHFASPQGWISGRRLAARRVAIDLDHRLKDAALCQACFDGAVAEGLRALEVLALPAGGDPLDRLAALADVRAWAAHHVVDDWAAAVRSAHAELGGPDAFIRRVAIECWKAGPRADVRQRKLLGTRVLATVVNMGILEIHSPGETSGFSSSGRGSTSRIPLVADQDGRWWRSELMGGKPRLFEIPDAWVSAEWLAYHFAIPALYGEIKSQSRGLGIEQCYPTATQLDCSRAVRRAMDHLSAPS